MIQRIYFSKFVRLVLAISAALFVVDGGRAAAEPTDTAKTERAVLLPPFVVEEKSAPRWQYARVPGLEVLSLCPDAITTEVLDQLDALQKLLEVILPKNLQFHSDVPMTCLLFSDSGRTTISKEFLAFLQQRETEAASARVAAGDKSTVGTTVGVLPNFRFWDQDSLSVFFIWDFRNESRMMLTPSYLRFILEKRTPALPPWFIEGMMELYGRVIMNTSPLPPSGEIYAQSASGLSVFSNRTEPNTVTIRRAIWVSEKLTDKLLQDFMTAGRNEFETTLVAASAEPVALEGLFSGRVEGANDKNSDAVRRCTAALFIRWMLADWKPAPGGARLTSTGGSSAHALWKFVERSSQQPVTEALFKDCFGIGYRDADDGLRDYLYVSLKNPFVLRPATVLRLGPVALRDATLSEVSRIKGDFNRLEIAYVRELFPELTEKYIEQARRTLRNSYNTGDRDPRLLAQLGLCECDAGNDTGALPFLESAVQAKVVRPRAYYELARIRFADLRGKKGNGRPSSRELENVLEPLFFIREQAPALGEAYELMAEVWLRTEVMPTREELIILNEGIQLFPRRTRLIFSAALINITLGHLSQAHALIERGLKTASDPAEKARFLTLKSVIPVGTKP